MGPARHPLSTTLFFWTGGWYGSDGGGGGRPALPCPVLSCPVLSCPVLSCPVPSYVSGFGSPVWVSFVSHLNDFNKNDKWDVETLEALLKCKHDTKPSQVDDLVHLSSGGPMKLRPGTLGPVYPKNDTFRPARRQG
eukprot:gene7511-biopygen20